jgi:hypothetical protein
MLTKEKKNEHGYFSSCLRTLYQEVAGVTGENKDILLGYLTLSAIRILRNKCLLGLVVGVLGRSGGPGSIPGTTRKKN